MFIVVFLKVGSCFQQIPKVFLVFQVLLRSDKGPANFSDRSLLKNLGHWLGIQTLGNNKPILFKVFFFFFSSQFFIC